MIRIDLENHFYAPCLIDALAQRSQPPFYDRATDQIHWTEDVCMPQGELLQRLLEVGEHRLSLLEQQGITHAVLSCSPGASSAGTRLVPVSVNMRIGALGFHESAKIPIAASANSFAKKVGTESGLCREIVLKLGLRILSCTV